MQCVEYGCKRLTLKTKERKEKEKEREGEENNSEFWKVDMEKNEENKADSYSG